MPLSERISTWETTVIYFRCFCSLIINHKVFFFFSFSFIIHAALSYYCVLFSTEVAFWVYLSFWIFVFLFGDCVWKLSANNWKEAYLFVTNLKLSLLSAASTTCGHTEVVNKSDQLIALTMIKSGKGLHPKSPFYHE